MEELVDILSKLNVSTNELTSNFIQEVLASAKKNCKSSKLHEGLWIEVSDLLWLHLQSSFNKFDNQLLCATCFYTVLTLTNKQTYYMNEVLEVINSEIIWKEKVNKESPKTPQAVSLMYGMFQSSFLIQKSVSDIPDIVRIMEAVLKLLKIMAYEYSKFTFIVFKTINSFKKVYNSELQQYFFTKNNQVELLNLVNHNWENPITGVRDINKTIFQTLISVVDEETYELILSEINVFYWNKAKYLMLSKIIEHHRKEVIDLILKNNWIDGLIYSLHKPGLVSAGADMYYAILNILRSEETWCLLFLHHIIGILSSVSYKVTENFTNYWCLTTLKKYPSLFKVIIHELGNLNDSEHKLYSVLCIIKQANKLGLLTKTRNELAHDKQMENTILYGLAHCNNNVRILAFDIVCVSQTKLMPTSMEYELVLDFVNNNVNSDCTVLRLSMLHSFDCFLTRLHTAYLYQTKNNQDSDIENLLKFCQLFQEFIITSMKINGNYQRKITCIKLANIFLEKLREVPRKRKQDTRYSDTTIINILNDKDQWLMDRENIISKLVSLLKDPAEDIREHVILLLLNHYYLKLKSTELTNHLIEDALKCMSSKFFYQINCGQSMFKLIINVLLKENHPEATFKNVEEIYNFACNELTSEYKLERGVVESIKHGKQLHSYMSILHVVLSVCLKNSYKIKISNKSMNELLEVLEGISNQFAWEQESSTSSDFSKMSDMVENIIIQAGYNSNDDHSDHTKISGLHQIVLNCLWLNVKASCDLSSLLIQYQRDVQIDMCEKCLSIITHVLETCRHKGAIEAAGTALGLAIQHLTSLPEDCNVSKIPYSLLKCKLKELISEASKMASVTRRGAGLSIMVHRIVSSDAKKGKPLFHYFMKTLLATCTNTDKIPEESGDSQDINNEKDLPKAIYIHFLTRIVIDSSLASDMMFYSAKLAELAFDSLTSSHWQIRNAALQLYGALIPKLIGQKKSSGTDDETIATVACDELRTHSKKLWQYIQSQLENKSYCDKLQYHSNLVPILNMLGNIARRYNFSYDIEKLKDCDAALLKSLILLLDSPIYTVRRLTAKCIFNIYPFEVIYHTIAKEDHFSENFLHGTLMMVVNYHGLKNSNNELYNDHFIDLKAKFNDMLNAKEHSYLSKELFEEIFSDHYSDEDMKQTLLELERNAQVPGVFRWANVRLQKYLQKVSWNMIPQFLKLILECSDFEFYCDILLIKIERDECIQKQVLSKVADILLCFNKKFDSSVIWKILYQISLQMEISKQVNMSSIINYLEGKQVSYKLRYMIPFAARISATSIDQKSISIISKIIYSFTDCANSDVDMRYIAALANNEIATVFNDMPEKIKVTALKSAVILLQDEDEYVRNLTVKFYSNLYGSEMAPHPYVCLFKLLDHKFLCSLLSQNGIEDLYNELSDLLRTLLDCKITDEYNPFANDSKNIYFEAEVLRLLIENLKKVRIQ